MMLPPPEPPLFRLLVDVAEIVLVVCAFNWWKEHKEKQEEETSKNTQ